MGLQLNLGTILTVLMLATAFYLVQGEMHCFKKIHNMNDAKRGPICRGIINKSVSAKSSKPFRSHKGCCRNGGVGYIDGTLQRMGKRGLKYPCTLCPHVRSPTTTVSSTTVSQKGWSEWGAWSQCSASCAVGRQERKRFCYSDCLGKDTEVIPCVLLSDCPVDGSWGPWNEWSSCSEECGGGNMTRNRRCNDPIPQHGGQECEDNAQEAISCATKQCPVHGGWSDWIEYPCSATCGRGVIVRNRSCDNPEPRHDGSECQGAQSKSEKCPSLPECPIDGQWSLWADWGSCDATCGSRRRVRERSCVAPKPKYGGIDCVGEDIDHSICYHPIPCAINGSWTDWDPWTSCLAEPCTGERGYSTRKRTCKNPIPRFGGALCEGNNNETQGCVNNEVCPVNGGWCDWSDYSECRVSNIGSFKIKTRECGCPVPENGGAPCTGIDFETADCLTEDERQTLCRNRQTQGVEEDIESSGYIDDEDC